MKIQFRINAAGALRNQRFAFTSRYALISELLQNARRAGATHIEIRHDIGSAALSVADDGVGIQDFQALLTLHESGWDAQTQQEESPFGVGFSKCLYASTRCVVRSNGRRIDFLTASALTLEPIEVEPDPASRRRPGCQVELHGVDLAELETRIEALCEGFPIAVSYNGQPMARRFAVDHLPMTETPTGWIHLAGRDDGHFARDTVAFLQGFCVLRPAWFTPERVNVVHLDPRQFMARLPDRDRLVDEEEQRPRIQAALKALWRETLLKAKARLDPASFVATYFQVMRHWGHRELLNDLDVLPAEICFTICDYPVQTVTASCDWLRHLEQAPTRASIENGSCVLMQLDSLSADNAGRWMLARQRGHLLVEAFWLDAGHWVHPLVRDLDVPELQIEAVGEQQRTVLQGLWLWPTVVLCEAVHIRIGAETAEVFDAGVGHASTLYIPSGEHLGQSLRQLSTYADENGQSLDHELGEDLQALAVLLRRLRAVDPLQTLESLLGELQLGRYPLLHGLTFQVTVGVGTAPGCSLELLDARTAGSSARSGERHVRH